MKALFSILTLTSSFSFAAAIESGIYTAVDVETKTITATLNVRADHTANLKMKTPDFVMAEPGCEGIYNIENNLLKADMKCPVEGLENTKVVIDITDVTPQSVRTENGVAVNVIIDALGSEAYKFNLKKLE